MCYWHLKKNVNENWCDYDVPMDYRDSIIQDINTLHYCIDENEFKFLKTSVLDKWTSSGLHKYVDYFSKQWLKTFCNWQLFNRPMGYATTNGPAESFNKQLKQTFSQYSMLPLIDAMNRVFIDVIRFYAVNGKPFMLYPDPTQLCKKYKTLGMNLHPNQFKVHNQANLVVYSGINTVTGLAYTRLIQINPAYCPCSRFYDKLYCHHIIAINRLGIADIDINPTIRKIVCLVPRKKKGRPPALPGTALSKNAKTGKTGKKKISKK